jgi:2-iminobutanoate/2-iminopropanoate deaminase
MPEIICTPGAPMPIGPYSQAIRANGFVFVSGQIPIEARTQTLVEGEIEIQTRQALRNLSVILDAAGSGLNAVVMTTVYLTDLDDFSRFNQVYAEYFAETKPARATVQVAQLPMGALVEISAIAQDQIAF